jgi:hypothetical protein
MPPDEASCKEYYLLPLPYNGRVVCRTEPTPVNPGVPHDVAIAHAKYESVVVGDIEGVGAGLPDREAPAHHRHEAVHAA